MDRNVRLARRNENNPRGAKIKIKSPSIVKLNAFDYFGSTINGDVTHFTFKDPVHETYRLITIFINVITQET